MRAADLARRLSAHRTALANFRENRRRALAGRHDLLPAFLLWTTLRHSASNRKSRSASLVRPEPGAVVCRVAPSFIRFGNFELPASRGDLELLQSLGDSNAP